VRELTRICAAASLGLAALALAMTAPRVAEAQLTEFCQFTGNPGPCGPYDQYQDSFGQELRMTLIFSPQGKVRTEPPAAAAPVPPPGGKLNTIRDVFGALRNCFAASLGQGGSQEISATLRFSFTRGGEILGEPRFTYVQPGISADMRQAFEREMGHALVACMPLPFTDGLGGALAGRPFSIRVIKPAKPPLRS
jgi:hypothetical protein